MNYNYTDDELDYTDFGYRPPSPADMARDGDYAPRDAELDQNAVEAGIQGEGADAPYMPITPTMPVAPVQYNNPAPPVPPIVQPYPQQAQMDPRSFAYGSAGAPGEAQGQPGTRQGVPEWSLRRRGEPRPDEWREPSYCEPRDTTYGMYTPGINVNQPYSRKRAVEPEPVRKERRRRGRAGRFFRAVCLVLLCASVSAAAAYAAVDYRFNRGDFEVVNQVVLGGSASASRQDEGMYTLTATENGMTPQDIYDMALTQVVGIRTDVPEIGNFGPMGSSLVSGSGFVISSDGYILTNFHVIESAQQGSLPITVVLHDATEYAASIIGYDKTNDVALLKIPATGLNPAVISNSSNIRVGQKVYAVGNPFGDLVYTMTDGIVSALDRIVTVDSKTISTFQFSAAVNSGNSGGPVYDENGEVLGIVTAKLMRGSVEGIGFAIPINDAIEIASGLIEHGYIAGRPLIGITAQTANSGHAEYFGWAVVGAYIRGVNPGSAAEKAGLMVGDIITAIGDTEVDSMESLRFALRRYRAGDTTTITAWRSGESIKVDLTFDEDLSAGQPEQPQQQRLPQQQTPQQQLPQQRLPQWFLPEQDGGRNWGEDTQDEQGEGEDD